jgi:16S rRNA U1498 N3-methylase RsmE
VNLVLLEPHELSRPLSADDPRAVHVLTVLRRVPGDTFDVGVVDGPRGKATLRAVDAAGLQLDFTWGPPPAPLPPLTLLVGLARPQTARKILQEATTLGVAALHFVRTERAEPQYAQSSLWSSGEWRDHLRAGAAQAFTTQLPRVTWDTELSAHLAAGSAGTHGSGGSAGSAGVNGPAGSQASVPSKGFAQSTGFAEKPDGGTVPGAVNSTGTAAAPSGIRRLALDNYEATAPLGAWRLGPNEACVLAIGPERGWGPRDRDALRAAGFALAHLGPRVLRSETAVVAALAILRADSGFA